MIVEGAAHAELAAALHTGAFPAGEGWDMSAMAALLAMPGCFACLAVAAGPAPAGMALVRVAADEAELLAIAVLPPSRSLGLGRALLEEAMSEAALRGAVRMFLEVAVTNSAARALYGAAGFRQAGRRVAYYADGVDALLLACALGFRQALRP